MSSWGEPLRMKIYDFSPVFLQNLFINADRLIDSARFSSLVDKVEQELEISERWSKRDLEELQNERLRKLIEHAYSNVPYYKELFKNRKLKPSDIRGKDDLLKIPFLTKDIVRNDFHKLLATNISKKELFHSHSSGTTGSPLEFYMDRYTQAFYRAHIRRHRQWWGYNFDEYCASFGGKVVVPPQQSKPPFWRYDLPEKLIVFSSFHLKPEFIDLMIEFIQRKNIRCMKGYPSNLFILAQYLREKGVTLPMKWVFTGAEPVFDYMREVMEAQFATKVADFYGLSEEAARAYQCPEQVGYHMAMESTLIEVVNDDGEVVEDEKYGEMIGTSLTNFAMPFIRYRTGDVTRVLRRHCPCGRQLSLIDQVVAKFEDVIVEKDGRLVSPSALTHPFKPINPKAILKSQIVQDEVGRITVKVVRGPGYDKTQERLLLKGFETRFLGQLKVEIVYVTDIERTSAGKYRWVVCNIPFDYKKWAAGIMG